MFFTKGYEMNYIVSIFLLIFLQCNFAHANEEKAGLSIQQANQFMTDAGMNELVQSLPQLMSQQLNLQRLMTVSGMTQDETKQAVNKAIAHVDGNLIALKYLMQHHNAKALLDALNFLASPLGLRISREEKEASSPEGQLAMQAYAKTLSGAPPSAKREVLIKQLTSALNAEQVVLEVIRGTVFSILDVAKGINPEALKTLRPEIKKEWRQMKPALKSQLAQYMVMSSHYGYRNISDSDLKQYMAFLVTESGKTYWHAGIEVIDLYIKQFVIELTKTMVK